MRRALFRIIATVLFIAATGLEAQLIRTRDWVIATNGVQLNSSTDGVSKGSWQGFQRMRDSEDFVVFRNGEGDKPWGGLQLKVDQASGTTLLYREFQVDRTTGAVRYRNFLTTTGLPGILWLPPTLPSDGSWTPEVKIRFIVDSHNFVGEHDVVYNDASWFDSTLTFRYAGRVREAFGDVDVIIRRDYWGPEGNYEEYLLGRLPDGSSVGLYGWRAPGWDREEIARFTSTFKTPVAYKLLMPMAGQWKDVWMWTDGATTAWVPAPPSPTTLKSPGGNTTPPPPTTEPPVEPPAPPEAPVPGGDIVIKEVDLDRILIEEAQVFIDDLRAALIR